MYKLRINNKVFNYDIQEFRETMRVHPMSEDREICLELVIAVDDSNKLADEIETVLNLQPGENLVIDLMQDNQVKMTFTRYTKIIDVNIQYVENIINPDGTEINGYRAFIVFSK